jgi:hypothetical protein
LWWTIQALEKTKAYLTEKNLEIPVIVEVRNGLEIDQVMNFPWVKRDSIGQYVSQNIDGKCPKDRW